MRKRKGKPRLPLLSAIDRNRDLSVIGDHADRLKIPAYLVGGAVRDLLLGKKIYDLDIVVEGDPGPLVEALAGCRPDRVRSHGRFGTFTVHLDNGRHIDFATARTERYPSAGVLPVVRPGTIREDLFRRDFTVNALALALGARDRGRVIDPSGGQKDLRRKTLQVIHDRSFRDDPTRIFRLARFAGRGFAIARATLRLVDEQKRYLSRVSPARVREELLCILIEKDPYPALALLDRWGLLDPFLPGLVLSSVRTKLRSVSGIGRRLAVLMGHLDAPGRRELSRELHLPRELKREIEARFKAKVPKPALSGSDLIELGYIPGPLFKEMLKSLSGKRFRSRREAVRFIIDKYPKKI